MRDTSLSDDEVLELEMSEMGQKPRWLQPKSTSNTKWIGLLLAAVICAISLFAFKDHIAGLRLGRNVKSVVKGEHT